MRFIPYGRQYIDEDDISAVVDALKSDWLTTGPMVQEFEKKLAGRAGAKYAVAFSSGTAALHAAYFAAGVGPGDEIITTPITFAATANAALYLGARPVFVDVRPDTVNINSELIIKSVTPKTRVLAPVDFAGHPADLEEIMDIAKKNNLVVVEDACHALGADYKGRPVGSLADMTVFSFHPVKHITTGEGGAVTTNSIKYYEILSSFRTHGMVRNKEKMHDYHGPWYHEMHFLGYNYRMTDIQSALGVSQLKKLDRFIKRRREIAKFYKHELGKIETIETPVELASVKHAWHLYVVRIKNSKLNRRVMYEKLHELGIGVQVHYIPVYWHPYYQKIGYPKGLCPEAELYYNRALSLPIFPSMDMADAGRVVDALAKIAV
ncbi:MAG: UDP-4-amino-4,6-dideoxy-N-acetyl-beta-L-altrosamine transaminase [Peptococcaceae bacterium]|nr:UDP-4-amino-4,6-dideoxy-N-acetyl-beta-L-altrosamine transaminase [Peptococcaceae bacterium]